MRHQAKMADGWDAGVGDAFDPVRHRCAALQFDGVASGLGHEAARVSDGGFDARLVGHVGHVADEERGWRAASDGLRVTDHIVHRNGQCRIVAKHRHAEAVADQDHFDARLFLQIGGWIIVAGEPGDRLAFGDFIEQIGQCDFLARFAHGFLR